MNDVFITSAVRTPIGKFLGGLASLPAPRLGAVAIKEAVRRAGIPADAVEEVIMGCVLQAGVGQAPARQASIYAGIPDKSSALTINKVCGSGLKAVVLAAQAIKSGDADVVVAGGMESMSNAPYFIPEARLGSRLGNANLIDSLIFDGLWDPYNNFHMGVSNELVAEEYKISRREMDEYAVNSNKKASSAIKSGRFRGETTPVEIKGANPVRNSPAGANASQRQSHSPIPQISNGAKGEVRYFEVDEGPREDSSVEKLSTLKPAFKEGGTVTAGNSSQISDGASALVIMSERKVREFGVRPLARITGYATGGTEPKWVMMAPMEGVKAWEKKCGMKRENMDLIEINEAFAAQVCALVRELRLDPAKVNVNGGAVALGHPIGASGARILTTLLYTLKDRKLRRGLATLCLGGGNAVALSVEMVG